MIAPIGYMPGGVGYMPGLGTLTPAELADGEAAGIPDATLQALDAAGATEVQISQVISGELDPDVLMTELSPAMELANNPFVAAPSGAASPSGSGQVPSGSTLVYTATWTLGFGDLTVTPNNVIQALASGLPSYGMSVKASQATSGGPITYGIQVTVQDTIGHALLSDAQSVLDGIVQSATGNNKTSSNLSLVAAAGAALPPGSIVAPPATTATQWLESNAVYIGLGLAALILIPTLLKK